MGNPVEGETEVKVVAFAESRPEVEHGYDEADKKMLPCHLFLQGDCENGGKCPYYHPLPEDLAAAIKSPPLPEDFGTEEGLAQVNLVGGGGRRGAHYSGTYRGNQRTSIGRATSASMRASRIRGGRSLPNRTPQRHQQQHFEYERREQMRFARSRDRNSTSYRPPRPRRQMQYTSPDQQPLHINNNYYGYMPPAPLYEEYNCYSPQNEYYQHGHGEETNMYDYGHTHAPVQYAVLPEEVEYSAYGEEPQQDTLFKHIEWMKFLAPGIRPPPVTYVQEPYDPPQRKPGRNLLELMKPPPSVEAAESFSEDHGGTASLQKLSPKEELKLKFERIGMELTQLQLGNEQESSPPVDAREDENIQVDVQY